MIDTRKRLTSNNNVAVAKLRRSPDCWPSQFRRQGRKLHQLSAVLLILTLSSLAHADETPKPDRQDLIIVLGASGTAEYEKQFRIWSDRWEHAGEQSDVNVATVGQVEGSAEEASDRESLLSLIEERKSSSSEPLWLVLIGHGTFDGQVARFNLRGPDIDATTLAKALEETTRPLAVINCASASGPFLNHLRGPRRTIITSTKSGYEQNYARFGDYLSSAITDATADLDKDQQTSLLEAFLLASKRTAEFYEQSSRLATEHALLDDNGDGRGVPADWFRGILAVRSSKDGSEVDGRFANSLHLIRSESEQQLTPDQRVTRDKLEVQLDQLRSRKQQLASDDYYQQLEQVLLQLAELYE